MHCEDENRLSVEAAVWVGGGSDGLHQLVSVFTNYMQSAAARAKRRKPEAESAG